jgi:hypothetical protein
MCVCFSFTSSSVRVVREEESFLFVCDDITIGYFLLFEFRNFNLRS